MSLSDPQVMVGIDDGNLGIENGLGRLLGQPGRVRGVDSAELIDRIRLAHTTAPSMA